MATYKLQYGGAEINRLLDVVSSTEQINITHATVTYTIFSKDCVVYAKNGTTGLIDYSGEASYVLQSAINRGGGDQHIIIKNDLLCSSPITISAPTIVEGTHSKYVDSIATLKYTGDNTDSFISIVYPASGVQLKNLKVDGNELADINVYVHVDNEKSIHQPVFENIVFTGYNEIGLCLGINEIIEMHEGQISDLKADRLWFNGGTSGAIGILSNAENLEWGEFTNLRFDPTPGKEHSYHIYNRSGAIQITGMITTRSTVFAIYDDDQMIINGWRAEEALLFNSGAMSSESPVIINGLQHRYNSFAGDCIIYNIIGLNSPLLINGARLNGNIVIGPTDLRSFCLTGVTFEYGSGLQLQGPNNQYGTIIANGILTNYVAGVARQYLPLTGGNITGTLTFGDPHLGIWGNGASLLFGQNNGDGKLGLNYDPNGAFPVILDGLFFPKMVSNLSAPSYSKGSVYFNTTLNKLVVGGSSHWESMNTDLSTVIPTARPLNPANGQIAVNLTDNSLEHYCNGAWRDSSGNIKT
jgi:hypothetical protein